MGEIEIYWRKNKGKKLAIHYRCATFHPCDFSSEKLLLFYGKVDVKYRKLFLNCGKLQIQNFQKLFQNKDK